MTEEKRRVLIAETDENENDLNQMSFYEDL